MSLVIEAADALVSELNAVPAGNFSQAFVAARHYRPLFDLEDLNTLHVSVVPKGMEITSVGRNANQHDVSIDIAVQQVVDPSDHAQLDALMDLVEEIADFFRLRRLSAMPAAIWIGTQNAPVYAPEHLEQMRVFTSVLMLTYRVIQ